MLRFVEVEFSEILKIRYLSVAVSNLSILFYVTAFSFRDVDVFH